MNKPCWFKLDGTWRFGTLVHWGVDSEQVREGVLTYTVGIIEDVLHKVHSVLPKYIYFGVNPPNE